MNLFNPIKTGTNIRKHIPHIITMCSCMVSKASVSFSVTKSKGVGRCSGWHVMCVQKGVWSHLGTDDPDGHLPQGCGIRSWLHLKQQVLLLSCSQLGRTERDPAEKRGYDQFNKHSASFLLLFALVVNSTAYEHSNACKQTQSIVHKVFGTLLY